MGEKAKYEEMTQEDKQQFNKQMEEYSARRGRHLLILCLLSHSKGLPALTKDDNYVNKLYTGLFIHDLGTRVKGEVVISASYRALSWVVWASHWFFSSRVRAFVHVGGVVGCKK